MNVVLIDEEAAGMRTLQSLQQCGVRVVRQEFREGICIPAREALKVGDRLADA
jgi:hypothetical protein